MGPPWVLFDPMSEAWKVLYLSTGCAGSEMTPSNQIFVVVFAHWIFESRFQMLPIEHVMKG